MKSFTSLFFLFLAVYSFAQTNLPGYVTLQNSNKKSAYPAQVKAWGATSTDVNTVDGSFKLVFDSKQPGDDASLEVIKEGYEVVNREALDVRLPDPAAMRRQLKIYLCPKGEWQHYADQFYKVNLTEINKSYEKKLANIREKYKSATIDNQEYRQALAKLNEELKAAKAQAESLAEKFAKANLDDASERYKLAYRLFSEGKIDSVLIVLQEDEMLRDLEEAEQEIGEGAWLDSIGKVKEVNGLKSIAASARTLVIKGQLHTLHGEWVDAQRNFDTALPLDSLNPAMLEQYAIFISQRLGKDVSYSPVDAAAGFLDLAERAANMSKPGVRKDLRAKARNWLEKASSILQHHPEATDFENRLSIIKAKLNE